MAERIWDRIFKRKLEIVAGRLPLAGSYGVWFYHVYLPLMREETTRNIEEPSYCLLNNDDPTGWKQYILTGRVGGHCLMNEKQLEN